MTPVRIEPAAPRSRVQALCTQIRPHCITVASPFSGDVVSLTNQYGGILTYRRMSIGILLLFYIKIKSLHYYCLDIIEN